MRKFYLNLFSVFWAVLIASAQPILDDAIGTESRCPASGTITVNALILQAQLLMPFLVV